MKNIGKTIKILRQAKALKVSALAKVAGVSNPFLSLVENGERNPSLAVLRKIAEGLGLPSEALILMSIENETEIVSSNYLVNDLSNNVSRLIELEAELKEKLTSMEHKNDSRENKSS